LVAYWCILSLAVPPAWGLKPLYLAKIGYHVFITAREKRGQAVLDEIKEKSGNLKVELLVLIEINQGGGPAHHR